MIRIILAINNLCLTWLLIRTASDKEHNYETDNPEDSLERKLHYAKANVEQCLHRTINLYVKLIDDRAHTSRLQKKTSDIDSRTVWPSFDIAKVWIILIHATFRRGFCLCRSNECVLRQEEARVSERKREPRSRVCLRRTCPLPWRDEWEALAEIAAGCTFADCRAEAPKVQRVTKKDSGLRPPSRIVGLGNLLHHML